MAWPDWQGPSLPTEWEDLPATLGWSAVSSGFYYGFYRYELSRTLSRMPAHAFRNPSKAAVLREAARRTAYPTATRGFGLAMRIFPAFNFIVTGLAAVSLLGHAQREGWLGLGGNPYQGDLPDDYVHPNYQTKRPTYTSDKIRGV